MYPLKSSEARTQYPGMFAQILVILVLIALPVGTVILILDFNRRTKRGSSTSK
jgi:hypothetical protein